MTGAGAAAAAQLTKEGIPTLGTCLFNIPQAIAASQAGMHAISVYFNRPLAGEEIQFWPDVADPATQHPMASRHVRIRQVYDRQAKETGKKQPQMKTAG
jgi:transaldolase